MATPAETAAMQRALALAVQAVGSTNPNPAVGAVVLSADERVVGEGHTAPIGGPHAEVVALEAAGADAVGGTVVVTLEPCRHVGRTGPCTDTIGAAGIRRVVFAVGDPHGDAAGGAEVLRAAGIDVESGVLAPGGEAGLAPGVRAAGMDVEPGVPAAGGESVLAPWLTAVRRRRPHLTWKYAATLDGRTAAADGTSRWITGPDARTDVHRLRARSDAVLVGIGTVLADDTALTVRDWPTRRQPLRVVVDGKARTPLSARILDDAAPTLVAVGPDADSDRVSKLRAA